jgi:hypothetical protein
VQPWQVLATQSPVAGLLGLALRGINALCSGACAMPAQPVISAPAEMPDAMMKVRLVSLMPCSWWEFGFVAFAMG